MQKSSKGTLEAVFDTSCRARLDLV